MEAEFIKAVEAVAKKNIPLWVTEGTVTKVDKDKNTCDVQRDDLPELLNVRLNSILEAGENVMTIYPQKGSKVLCIMIEDDPNDAFVIASNNIEELSGKIKTTDFLVNAEGFQIQRGDNNLMDLMESLITELQKIVVVQGNTVDINALEQIKLKMKEVLQ